MAQACNWLILVNREKIMSYPSIDGLLFEKCCNKTLEDIESILKTNGLLHIVIPIAVFGTILVSHTRGGSGLATAVAIKNTDFVAFGLALKGLGQVTAREIRKLCAYEHLMRHSGGKLHEFWRAMDDVFLI